MEVPAAGLAAGADDGPAPAALLEEVPAPAAGLLLAGDEGTCIYMPTHMQKIEAQD